MTSIYKHTFAANITEILKIDWLIIFIQSESTQFAPFLETSLGCH